MTVYKIGNGKIKITLTDSEVLSYFGEYESLNKASYDTRLTVGLILSRGLEEVDSIPAGDLLVEIRARKSAGCVITVSEANMGNRQKTAAYVFEFENSEALILGAKQLYRFKGHITDSRLYLLDGLYRLIIGSIGRTDFSFMREFCRYQTKGEAEAEYTSEYGRLIAENALPRLSRAFRDF